jgi:predicted transcriptional regulator
MAVEFSEPAQLHGTTTAEALQWIVLLFRESGDASFHLHAEGPGLVVNHTMAVLTQDLPYHLVQGPTLQGAPNRTESLQGPVEADAGFGRWGSLFVQANSIQLTALGEADLHRAAASNTVDLYLPDVGRPTGTYRPSAYKTLHDGPALSIKSEVGRPLPFHLNVSGLQRLEWHNATLSCRAGSCPDGGGAFRAFQFGGAESLQVMSYTQLDVTGGELEGQGVAWAVAAGGATTTATLSGSLRLPQAELQGQCPQGACPDPAGKTFLAKGNMTLANLTRASKPGRLTANLDGSFADVAFDESHTTLFALPPSVAVATAAALVGTGLLVKLLLSLFTRHAEGFPLDHPRRRELAALIQAEPGLSLRELSRRSGISTTAVRHHLKRLVDGGAVVSEQYRNTVRFFENHGRYKQTWRNVVVLKEPELGLLKDWLLAHPGAHQRQVIAEAAAWGWKRSQTQERLRMLVDAGIVAAERKGRRLIYTPSGAL